MILFSYSGGTGRDACVPVVETRHAVSTCPEALLERGCEAIPTFCHCQERSHAAIPLFPLLYSPRSDSFATRFPLVCRSF
jgi:hypothetical protein